MWLLFFPLAYFRGASIFYTSSFRAALSEELVYRGFVYGAAAYLLHSQLYALALSSVVFGLAHMRNLWWAGWRRSWHTSTYAGFKAGPVLGAIRWLNGDIYLGMLLHFIHNLIVILPPPGLKHRMAPTPTNAELRAKSRPA